MAFRMRREVRDRRDFGPRVNSLRVSAGGTSFPGVGLISN